jgi:hypothetical protein
MLESCDEPTSPLLDQLETQSDSELSSLAAAARKFKKVSADGLPCWEAQVEWYDDPFDPIGNDSKNEVCSTIKVEVVRADLL